MTIVSLQFVGFVIIALVVYRLLPNRWQNYFLLFASYIFYISWQWKFALVLVGLTTITFLLGWRIELLISNSRQNDRRKTSYLLWLGIACNLLTLGFFKYAGFYLDDFINLANKIGFSQITNGIRIILPVGLSFYSLQAISYLVDVYRGQITAEKDPFCFALYLAYFPKMLAGPIERARDFLPKLHQSRIVDNQKIKESLVRIVIGTFRKLVLSDSILALMPWSVLHAPLDLRTQDLLVWWVAYGFIVYNDFAGYTSIARGISGLFGIELSSNFEYPFFSKGFGEFWNRWHITLSHWLRDYIYFPVSRSLLRKNPKGNDWVNIITPPLVTMLISGLWHGAYLHMMVWGALNGLLQGIERLIASRKSYVGPTGKVPFWRQFASRIIVVGVSFGLLVPFAMDLPVAWDFIRTLNEFGWPAVPLLWLRPTLAILISLGLDSLQYKSKDEFIFLRWSPVLQSFLLAFSLICIFIVTRSQIGIPFIYQEF